MGVYVCLDVPGCLHTHTRTYAYGRLLFFGPPQVEKSSYPSVVLHRRMSTVVGQRTTHDR